jgi:hydrogenase maturation protease
MNVDPGGWEALERPGPDAVVVDGVEVRRGSRVRLAPRPGGDVFDLALAGRTALVDAIETDLDGGLLVAVTVDDDPGRDLGEDRRPGHRFFFSTGEVEPLPDAPPEAARADAARVLVAGIGNVFLADDGFGVAVADRLGRGRLPAGVDVVDYGIRGMDLAYALADYDLAILVDVAPRGGSPGTLYVIEADLEASGAVPEAHGMDPVKVLALARELGPLPARVLVVACEPRVVMTGEEDVIVAELSEPVRAAVEPAARLVLRLLEEHRPNPIRETEEQ